MEAIQVAEKNGMRELDLHSNFWCDRIVHLNSLVAFEVEYSGVKQQVMEIISCPNLKRLSLRRVRLNQQTFQNIMSSCKLIEDLKLDHCYGPSEVVVTELQYLKKFTFIWCCRTRAIEIDAPNLEFLDCTFDVRSDMPSKPYWLIKT